MEHLEHDLAAALLLIDFVETSDNYTWAKVTSYHRSITINYHDFDLIARAIEKVQDIVIHNADVSVIVEKDKNTVYAVMYSGNARIGTLATESTPQITIKEE